LLLESTAVSPRLVVGCFVLFACACGNATTTSSTTPTTAPHSTVFRITPVRPIEDLKREALAASPPAEEGKLPSDLVELTTLDNTILFDIRYATDNNFLGTRIYDEARAFMQRPAAEAVVRVHHALAKSGYGLLIHDAYRPWYVTKMFWDATPVDKHEFVANPEKGSRHNRGCAVDLTLFELATKKVVEMTSAYDEMTDRAKPSYTGGTPEQRAQRDRLRAAMEAEGFTVYEVEWWHFDFKDWKKYPIGNVTFDKIPAAMATPSSSGGATQ
jgi:zinc D-Ala-D-Ala dipeptidase